MPRTNLYEIAARLVRKSGIDALTMDSLAEASGLSRATVYRQLGSREALLEELARRGVDVGDRTDVRERILTAAGEIFPRHGLAATTVENIAEAAGVGSATVYRHFGDKKGLVQAFLSSQSPRRAVWSLAKKPSGDLRADLTLFARTALEFLKHRSSLIRLALIENQSAQLADFKRSPDRTVHACTALLAHYAARGALKTHDPQAMARAFLGIVLSHGLFDALVGLPVDTDPERDSQIAVALFLDGARAAASDRAPSGKRRKS